MVVPDEYALCPKEYRGQADDKYLDCEIAAGQDYCTLLTELHEAKDFRSVYLTLQPMGLAVLALLANSALATLCAAQLLSHNSKNRPSSSARKRFALLLSRSVACLLTLLSFLAVLLVWRFGLFNYFSVVMLLSVAIAQFLAMASTHLTLSSLLFLAVLHPLFYRTRVSMGRCWTLIGLIWMLAIGASVPFGVLGATLFYPESAPITCPFNQCKWPVSLCLVVLLSLAYLLTIGCHLAMLCRMRTMHMGRVEPRRCQSKESTPSNSSLSDVRAMNRLTLNLVVFSLCKVPFLLIAVIGLAGHPAAVGPRPEEPMQDIPARSDVLQCGAAVLHGRRRLAHWNAL